MNTKWIKVIGLLSVGIIFLTACGLQAPQTVRGSGNAVTEIRQVSGFDSVSHTGIGRVIITQGDEEMLAIEADDNIMEYITSEVKGGTLELGFVEDISIDPVSPIVFMVSAKNLNAIDSVGTGTVEMEELITERLEISTNGTGGIAINEISATDLVTVADGTGEIKLAGDVETQEISQVGTGDYNAPDLKSKTANVEVTGTGGVVIWVTDSLDVVINGTSEVSYYGSPTVTKNITGTGSLTSLGDK